jgi:hypothetical protein
VWWVVRVPDGARTDPPDGRHGMLRIHFTAEDHGRVRLSAGADPLWETRLSARLVNDPRGARGALGRWRADVVQDFPQQALPYLHLNPPRGYSPDFLVPEAGSSDLAAGIDAVLGTPAGRMAAELARLDVGAPASGWVSRLAAGAPNARACLRATIVAYHRHAVAPVWDSVRSAVEADRAAHAHLLVTGGTRDALAALHPAVAWSGQTLTVDDGRGDRDLHLAGRGLRLVTSYFCGELPVSFEDPGLEPTLVLPVTHARYDGGRRAAPSGVLAPLLGRTRSAARRAPAPPVTTGALARRKAKFTHLLLDRRERVLDAPPLEAEEEPLGAHPKPQRRPDLDRLLAEEERDVQQELPRHLEVAFHARLGLVDEGAIARVEPRAALEGDALGRLEVAGDLPLSAPDETARRVEVLQGAARDRAGLAEQGDLGHVVEGLAGYLPDGFTRDQRRDVESLGEPAPKVDPGERDVDGPQNLAGSVVDRRRDADELLTAK